jgi:hypothetical protein
MVFGVFFKTTATAIQRKAIYFWKSFFLRKGFSVVIVVLTCAG